MSTRIAGDIPHNEHYVHHTAMHPLRHNSKPPTPIAMHATYSDTYICLIPPTAEANHLTDYFRIFSLSVTAVAVSGVSKR